LFKKAILQPVGFSVELKTYGTGNAVGAKPSIYYEKNGGESATARNGANDMRGSDGAAVP
jgi:hypothetical protein